MPHTINGIGTWYYGARNRTVRQGRCEQCGRTCALTSYDTRECFCFIFIPIIPLRRYRIFDECAACRRHRRAPVATLERAVEERAAPLRQRYATGNAEAGLELANLYLANERFDRAAAHLTEMVARHATNAEVNRLLGWAHRRLGQPRRAIPFLEAAVRHGGGDEKYLEALAYAQVEAKEHAAAESRFRELLKRDPRRPAWLYQFAQALRAQGKQQDAAAAYDALYAAVPEARSDPAIVDASLQVKQAAGRTLTPAEMDALRARGHRRAVRLAVAGACLVLGLVGVGAVFGLDRTVRVVVDNQAGAPASVRLDGADWLSVPAHTFLRASLRRGGHAVEASAAGRTARFDVDAAGPDLWANVFGSATFVCDLFGRGVYSDREVVYGAPGAREAVFHREAVLHLAEHWFLVAQVDYLFADPPQTIEVEKYHTARRYVVDRFPPQPPLRIAEALLARNRAPQAIELLEDELERGATTQALPDYLAAAATLAGAEPAVTAWLARHRTGEPASTQFHRAYQSALERQGKLVGLEREYDEFVAQHPGSAMAQYLRGRIAQAGTKALAFYRKAIELDATYPWAHLGAAYQLALAERYDEALPECREFSRLAGADNEEARGNLWRALLQARQWQELDESLRPFVAAGAAELDESALYLRALLLLYAGRPEAEWTACLGTASGRTEDPHWGTRRQLERAIWLARLEAARPLLAQLEAGGGPGGASAGAAAAGLAPIRWGLDAAGGDWAAAEKTAAGIWTQGREGQRPAALAVLIGITAEWTGHQDAARAWYDKAAGEAHDPALEGIARLLRKGEPAAAFALPDVARPDESFPLALLAQALRADDAGARERLLDRVLRLRPWEIGVTTLVTRALFAQQPPAR